MYRLSKYDDLVTFVEYTKCSKFEFISLNTLLLTKKRDMNVEHNVATKILTLS